MKIFKTYLVQHCLQQFFKFTASGLPLLARFFFEMKKFNGALIEIFNLKVDYGISTYLLWDIKREKYFVSTEWITRMEKYYELIKYFK